MLNVKSIMSRALVVATPDDSVATAMQRLAARDVGAVLVVCEGRVCGILSERDVLRRVVARGREPDDTRVGDVATSNPVAVRAEASIKECTELIRGHGFRHLPVVDAKGRPVGIVSSRDLLDFVVRGLERYIDRQRGEPQSEERVDPYETFSSAAEDAAGPAARPPVSL